MVPTYRPHGPVSIPAHCYLFRRKHLLHCLGCCPGRHARVVTAERCVCSPTWNVGTIRWRACAAGDYRRKSLVYRPCFFVRRPSVSDRCLRGFPLSLRRIAALRRALAYRPSSPRKTSGVPAEGGLRGARCGRGNGGCRIAPAAGLRPAGRGWLPARGAGEGLMVNREPCCPVRRSCTA